MNDVCVCIACGCDDLNPCPGGCAWMRKDDVVQLGVCSRCPTHVVRFDAGDLQPTDEAMETFADREDSEHAPTDPGLILPGDQAFDETLRFLRNR